MASVDALAKDAALERQFVEELERLSKSEMESKTAVNSAESMRSRGFGWLAVGLTMAGIAGLYAVVTPFVTPALRKHCLPFVPASKEQIDLVVRYCRGRGKMVDLGSGDGRVAIATAKELGIPSVGIELNYWLVLYSRMRARLQGVGRLATFYRKDLFTANIKDYDTIVIFGVQEMLADVERKLEKEMRDDARVVCCRFGLPSWTPCEEVIDPKGEKGIANVWVYGKQATTDQQKDEGMALAFLPRHKRPPRRPVAAAVATATATATAAVGATERSGSGTDTAHPR